MEFEDVLSVGRNIRVHPNGFIQIDMPGDHRLHVWCPSRISGYKASPHPIHNHSFSVASKVLYGRMVNHIVVDILPPGDVMDPLYTYTAYVSCKTSNEDTRLEQVDHNPVALRFKRYEYVAGQEYYMAAELYHLSEPDPDTITLIRKVFTRDVPCRVLIPQGVEPMNSFTRYAVDPGHLWDVVAEVFDSHQ